MAPKIPIPGGCNCGEVRYLVTKPPLASYICHCHLCQKRTGSAFSMTVVIPAGGFELVAGNQIWTSSAQPWALVRDNIVSFEEQPTDFAAAFAAAKKLSPCD